MWPAVQPAPSAPDAPEASVQEGRPDTASPDGRLVLVGTGHVLQIQETVRAAIEALRPDVVFIELDAGRLRSLMERRAGRPHRRAGGWVHRRLQNFQETVAKAYGAEPGGEMLAAVEGAQATGAAIHLVDRRVDITLKRALKELTLRERLRALGMMAGGFLKSLLPGRKDTRAVVEAELSQYSADPEKALDELGDRFPTLRRVVIDERDEFMAQRVRSGLRGVRLGVAVVGDGHVPGLLRHLGDLDVEAYRLDDVRQGRLPRPDPREATGNARVSFGFDLEA